jgi:phosphohistidine phosphatase
MLYLVHHGDAVPPDVNPQRPLSTGGRASVERTAAQAVARGARPQIVWHSGKLRAKQTAEIFWRACNPLGTLSASRDLQPDDPPEWIRDRLLSETQDLLIAGHFPHLPRLLALLSGEAAADAFPAHGVVAIECRDDGRRWSEVWRLSAC